MALKKVVLAGFLMGFLLQTTSQVAASRDLPGSKPNTDADSKAYEKDGYGYGRNPYNGGNQYPYKGGNQNPYNWGWRNGWVGWILVKFIGFVSYRVEPNPTQ